MLKINIICIGKIKEKYLVSGIKEYEKRLKRFCNLNIIELREESVIYDSINSIDLAREREFILIENNLKNEKNNIYNILLDINGELLNTIEFAKKIDNLKNSSISQINFIIGSSYGVSKKIEKYVDFKLSFSKMTYPHQLFRLILLEQIYRVFKINNNEVYHK